METSVYLSEKSVAAFRINSNPKAFEKARDTR